MGAAVKKRASFLGLSGVVSLFYLFLALPTVWYGPYNPDEGWYLHSAWLTWRGQVPYRDFAFPQPPVFLLVHGVFQALFGPGFYVGRLVNMGIGLVVVLVGCWIAYKISGKWAGLMTGLLLASSGWFVLQMVSVSTYALAGLFLLCLTYAWYKKSWLWVGVLSVLVAWTRFSLLPLIPLTLLAVPIRIYIDQKSWRAIGSFVGGMALATVFFIGPFLVLAPGYVWLNVIGYHALTRQTLVTQMSSGTSAASLVHNFFVYFQTQYRPVYSYAWLAALTSLVVFLVPTTKQVRAKRWLVSYIFLLAIPIALAHALAENVTYDVPLLGMLAVAGGVGIAALLDLVPHKRRLPELSTVASAGLVVALSFWSTRDVYNGVGEHEESPQNIQRIVRYVDTHSVPSDTILTPELYIPLEAQRDSVHGMELGRFFYFPKLSRDEALRRGVMNDGMLAEAIQSRQAKFIIINSAHFWDQLPNTTEEHRSITTLITQAGYATVPSLNQFQPAIDMTRVYERSN